MKRKNILGILMLCILVLTGCTVTNISYETPEASATPTPEATADWPEHVLMKVNGREIDYREVQLFLLSAKEEAELLYGEGIWEYTLDEEGRTYGDLRREQVLSEVIDICIACTHAEALGVETYEEENRDVSDYTAEFIENVGRDKLLQYNITEALIKQLYVDNIIAQKVYESITLSVDTDISDEEARQMKIQYIYKSKYKDAEEDTDASEQDGSTASQVLLSEEELLALREEVQTLRDTGMTRDNFLSYAELNTDSTDGAETYIGVGDLPTELERMVFVLRDGEFSPVMETEDGFYIIKCVTSFDEDATALRKEAIIVERQEATFAQTFATWKEAAEITINQSKWESLEP